MSNQHKLSGLLQEAAAVGQQEWFSCPESFCYPMMYDLLCNDLLYNDASENSDNRFQFVGLKLLLQWLQFLKLLLFRSNDRYLIQEENHHIDWYRPKEQWTKQPGTPYFLQLAVHPLKYLKCNIKTFCHHSALLDSAYSCSYASMWLSLEFHPNNS